MAAWLPLVLSMIADSTSAQSTTSAPVRSTDAGTRGVVDGDPRSEVVGESRALPPARPGLDTHVRSGVAAVRRMIAAGLDRSETMRRLVDELERRDVMIFVQALTCSRGVEACTNFVSAAEGRVILTIGVNTVRCRGDALIARLAHEFQHALEILDAGDARDHDAVRRLYERIGVKGWAGYETAAARATERQVVRELAASSP